MAQAPHVIRFLLNAAIDQNCEKYILEKRLKEAVEV